MTGKEQTIPELTIYQQTHFPAIYKWQATAFMRMEWSSIFCDDNLYMSETSPRNCSLFTSLWQKTIRF